MPRQEETRLVNPSLIVLVLAVILAGLGGGYWLTREKTAPISTTSKAEPSKKRPKPKEEPKLVQADPASSRIAEATETGQSGQSSAVSGKVFLGQSDAPAPGATVQAVNHGPSTKFTRTVQADSGGLFKLEDLPPSDGMRIHAGGPGFAEVHAETYDKSVRFATGQQINDVALRVVPSATIEGKVLNVIGKEIPGARIEVFDGFNLNRVRVAGPELPHSKDILLKNRKRPLAVAVSDNEGRFRLDSLEAGVYGLIAYATGYARKALTNVRTGASEVVFRLEPEVVVHGTVRLAPAGTPISGATISAEFEAPDLPSAEGDFMASASGTYAIRGLPRKFNLSLQGSTKEAESARYQIRFSGGFSDYKQDLLIIPDRKISAQVVDSKTKKPIPDVEVRLSNRLNESYGKTDAEGRFAVTTGVVWNDLTLAKGEEYRGISLKATFEDDSPAMDFGVVEMIHGVPVSGRVIDAKTKAGIEKASVQIFVVDQAIQELGRFHYLGTKQSGEFQLEPIPPGRYSIKAEAFGYKPGYYGDPKSATTGFHPMLEIVEDRPVSGIQIALTPATGGNVGGSVVDETGKPVTGARLSLRPTKRYIGNLPSETYREAKSDEAGRFQFKNAPADTYILGAFHQDYWPASRAPVVVSPESASQEVEIVLSKKEDLSISGRVLDKEGRPLAGITVTPQLGRTESLMASGSFTQDGMPRWFTGENSEFFMRTAREDKRSGRQSGRGMFRTAAVTDWDGSYEISGVRSGKYAVFALDPDTGAFDARYDVDAGAEDVDFTLAAGGALSGVVLLLDGKTPCKSYTISAFPVSEAAALTFAARGKNSNTQQVQSEAGTFELSGLSDGIYTLNVRAEGVGEASSFGNEVANGQGPAGITIILNGGGSILGRVNDPEGKPAIGARVSLGEVDRSLNPDGSFSFLGLAPDRYAIAVRHHDYATQILPNIDLKPEMRADLGVITLTVGGLIQGQARYKDGNGAAGFIVEAEPERGIITRDTEGSNTSSTDDSGYFLIPKLADGQYRVTLSSPYSGSETPYGKSPIQSKMAFVHTGQPAQVEFVLDEGVHITGKITLGGQPLARSTIVLYPRSPGNQTQFAAMTDPWGGYEFTGVPPGSYEASVAEMSPDGGKSGTFTVPDRPDFQQNFAF